MTIRKRREKKIIQLCITLTMVSPKIETGWSVFIVLAIVSVYFGRSRVFSIHSRIEFTSVMACRRLTFPIIAVDFKTGHFQDIRFIYSLHFLTGTSKAVDIEIYGLLLIITVRKTESFDIMAHFGAIVSALTEKSRESGNQNEVNFIRNNTLFPIRAPHLHSHTTH